MIKLLFALLLHGPGALLLADSTPLNCSAPKTNAAPIYMWMDTGNLSYEAWRSFLIEHLACAIANAVNGDQLYPVTIVPIDKPLPKSIPSPSISVILSTSNNHYRLTLYFHYSLDVGREGGPLPDLGKSQIDLKTPNNIAKDDQPKLLAEVPAAILSFLDSSGSSNRRVRELIWGVVKLGTVKPQTSCGANCKFDIDWPWISGGTEKVSMPYIQIHQKDVPLEPFSGIRFFGQSCLLAPGASHVRITAATESPFGPEWVAEQHQPFPFFYQGPTSSLRPCKTGASPPTSNIPAVKNP